MLRLHLLFGDLGWDFRSFEEANLKLIELKNTFPQFREMRVVKDMIRLTRIVE